MIKRVFVLGAKDPEMNRIETILEENKQDYVYASIDGKRCHPGNSYSANNVLSADEIIFIECSSINNYGENTKKVYLDHHKKGDYGYDLDYRFFLSASSLGQLIKYLIENNIYKSKTRDFYVRKSMQGFMFFRDENSWYFKKSEREYVKIKEIDVLIAAADHSLSEAYKGLCVGVDKNKLIKERLREIAEPLNNDIDLVKKTMNKHLNHFKSHSLDIFDLRHLELGTGYSVDYLCLRDLAISYNQPIVVKTRDSEDSPERVMFLALRTDQAEKILSEKKYNGMEISKIFGVPNRGYVGGILI